MWCGTDLSAEERRRRDRRILAAYCADDHVRVEDIAAANGVTKRWVSIVASRAGVQRQPGRQPLWPGCPPEKRSHFNYLRRLGLTAAEARTAIEMELRG